MIDRKFKKLMDEIMKDKEDPCDLCGRKDDWGLNSSHTSLKTYNKNRLWVNVQYELKLTLSSPKLKSKVRGAKVCHACHRRVLFLLTWKEYYDITVGKWWWNVKTWFNGLNPLTQAFIMNGLVILGLLGLQWVGVIK